MNKKVVNITYLVAGILTAAVALFYAIAGIISLTNFSSDFDASVNVYIAIIAVLEFGVACGLAIFSYFIIKEFVNNSITKNKLLYSIAMWFAYEFISLFIWMCFWGFGNAYNWVVLVIAVVGFVVALLSITGSFVGNINKILALVSFGIGFVLSIVLLVDAGGIGIAIDLFLMFMAIAYFLYYLFGMIESGEIKATNETKVEDTKKDETIDADFTVVKEYNKVEE